MKTFNCGQLTPEWWALRRGVLTASRVAKIITAKTQKLSAQADGLIYELLGELYRTTPPSEVERTGQMNYAMRFGQDCEHEARRYYEMTRGVDVEQVGFCLSDDGRLGCSPDGLVGDAGCLEIKAPQPATQIRYLLDDGLPDEYRPQVHTHLLVTERDWCDFLAYSGHGLPHLLVRVTPDDYTETLRAALDEFGDRYARLCYEFAKRFGPPPEAVPVGAGDVDSWGEYE